MVVAGVGRRLAAGRQRIARPRAFHVLRENRVLVVESPHDEEVTHHAHHGQHERADHAEAEDLAEHDFAGADRFGDERVDGARFHFRRQTERRQHHRQQQDQEVARVEHEAQIDPRRIVAADVHEQAGEQQHHDEDDEGDEHCAAE